LIVKNHSFVDGNKRIGAASFLLFLERNNMLRRTDGTTAITSEALVSLTLFVAASKSQEMKTVKHLIISFLNRDVATA
jgi:prophage maintenance system killer protein